MQFPTWIDAPHLTPNERRTKRLKYLINSLTLNITGSGTLREFARITAIDHSTIAYAVKQGRCSDLLAARISEKLKEHKLYYPAEWFVDTLKIPATASDTK